MKSFEDFVGNSALTSKLRRMVVKRCFPNKAIIAGPYGAGKTALGNLICQSLICEKFPMDEHVCGDCFSCRNLFPYLMKINCYEKELNSALGKEIRFHLQIAGSRFLLLDEIHGWQKKIEQVQGLLDGLSERRTVVMTTHRPEKLPPAFTSRCYQIDLNYPSDESLKRLLIKICKKNQIPIDDNFLNQTLERCSGNVREALVLLEERVYIRARFTSQKM